jgi:hypothetical protein
MLGGGYPGEPIRAELRGFGIDLPTAPRIEAARIEALRRLWTAAGLEVVETREITVTRIFLDFDDFWTTTLLAASIGPTLASLSAGDAERLKARVRERMPPDNLGRISYDARANAVKGRVP